MTEQFIGGFFSVRAANPRPSSGSTKNRQIQTPVWTGEVDAKIIASGHSSLTTMGLPTVEIQIFNMWLEKALIHYVVLELAAGSLVGQIPALLLSHQRSPKKCLATVFGYLLPLFCRKKGEDIAIWPILSDPCFKKKFMNGCKFKLRWITTGST